MASTAPVAHLTHRVTSLNSVIRNQVKFLWKSGVANVQILSVLHMNYPKVQLTTTDITNITQSIRNQELDRKTLI